MRPLLSAAVLSAAALLSACAGSSAMEAAAVEPVANSVPAEDATQVAFSTDQLSEHARVLSSDEFEGRGIATPAEQKVIDYLSQQYAAAGFEPGGPNGAWTQDVALRRFTVSNLRAGFTAGGETIPVTQGQQMVVSTRLPAEHQHLMNRELVFVGYGIDAPERQWDDFKDVDVRGKVVVILVNDADFEEPELNTFNGQAMTYYGRWTYKYEEAARQGAAGAIIVHEAGPASYGWATVNNSWTGPQFDIVRDNPSAERVPMEAWVQREIAVDLFRRAGLDFEALKVQARSRDFRPVTLTGVTFDGMFDVATSAVTTHNVIARLPGTTHPDETILYTAHWDHLGVGQPDAQGDAIFNGAVDNATGTAGLLELARAFGAEPRPERSIVMISFTAEESGLLGSEFYAANPVYPLEKTVAGFNIDAMNVYGRVSDMGLVGFGQSELDDIIGPLAQAQGRTLTTEGNPAAGGYFRSDHFPLAKRGVPMAYGGGGGEFRDEPVAPRIALRDEYGARRYHQADDEWSADWDLRGQAEDLFVFFQAGEDLANSHRWPNWKPGSEFGPVRAASADRRR